MLRRQVWSDVEVDELMQGAATRSVERIGELIERPRPMFGWLCQLVRHQRVDWLRARAAVKRSAPTGQLVPHLDVADTGTTPTQAERRTRVREMFDQVLGHLDTADADLLRLQVVAHLTPTEIAARLRITPENARIQLFRARGKAAAAWQALFPQAAAELRALGVLPTREQPA
jgi:RNA polymerase sigma factor (sigma-70 family)